MAVDNAYLLDTCFGSDLTIICHDAPNDPLRVHRAVLAARSIHFRTMLTNLSTAEAQNGTINVTDVGINVFRPLLTYLYQGHCALPESLLADLFVAADKYQLLDLKTKCERELLKTLRKENALDIALFAHRRNAESLQLAAVRTIAHHWPEIAESAETFDKLAASPALLKYVVGVRDKKLRDEKDVATSRTRKSEAKIARIRIRCR